MNATPTIEEIRTTCAIAGGGPAGMMLGFLLARAGVKVMVLEKHQDFLRDFRGDTIHPSTLELMHELGLLQEFLKLPHGKVHHISAAIGTTSLQIPDFTHLPTQCPFIAMMPQWDFLNFLAEQGARYPAFDLRMKAEVTELIEQDGRCVGLRAKTPTGGLAITAALVVGADGRHSTVRERAGLVVDDLGAPIDVLWMRLSRQSSDGDTFMRIGVRKALVMLDRGDYWQCAFVIPKGGAEEVRQRGLQAFRADIVELAPLLKDRVTELQSWDDIKLLSVKVDRLRNGTGPASCASATRRMRCRRLAAWASISPSRMRWRRRTGSPVPCAQARSVSKCWPTCSGVGRSQLAQHRGCSSSRRTISCARCFRPASCRRHHGRCV